MLTEDSFSLGLFPSHANSVYRPTEPNLEAPVRSQSSGMTIKAPDAPLPFKIFLKLYSLFVTTGQVNHILFFEEPCKHI